MPREQTPQPTRRTQAERSGETRRRILDAAVELLGERGYAGLRTGDVAAAAGVSKGAQTHHFPSKDDLVVAVVEHVFKRASEQAKTRARRRMTADEAVSIVRGLAVRRLWQHDPPRFKRLFKLWREMVAQHLATITTDRPRTLHER